MYRLLDRLVWRSLLAAVLSLGYASGALATPRSDAIWLTFRKANPLHTQVVGLSDASLTGERVLIIAEPSPLLPRQGVADALRSVFGAALREVGLKRNEIGIDGWSEDVVAIVAYPHTTAGDAQLAADMVILAQRLFGTAYKFGPIRLEATPLARPVRREAPPSLSVSAAELVSWLMAPGAVVHDLSTGESTSVVALLAGGRPGVYSSRERGLVMLLLQRQVALEVGRAALRQFALDSDAIIGALSTDGQRLMIVGRERDTTLAAVPPLRAETILALAATRESELGQSYERNAPLAGKLSGGEFKGADWAPIYLSAELKNSEFGSLLNITDQMLKGWSEAGTVQYSHFDYPPPATYPFPDGIATALQADSLTYNWNTVGVGSVSVLQGVNVFTIHRTGALPVSYCPGETCRADRGQEIVDAEEKAYRWYEGLRDPYLGRVVQYAALYQIFRAFPMQAKRDESAPPNSNAPAQVLIRAVEAQLNLIADGHLHREIEDRVSALSAKMTTLAPLDRAARIKMIRALAEATLEPIDKAQTMLNEVRRHCREPVLHNLAVVFADRQSRVDIRCDQALTLDFNDLRQTVVKVVSRSGDRDQARRDFMAAAVPVESGFIKTPSIVLSQTSIGEGGHNLYSTVTRIEASNDVARGTVAIEQSGRQVVLRINPEDATHSTDLARTYARNADRPQAELRPLLEAGLVKQRSIRTPVEGLQLTSVEPAEGRGLTMRAEGDLAIGEVGSRPASDPVDIVARYMAEAKSRQIDTLVMRDSSGYHIFSFVPPPGSSIRASTEPAMLEAFARKTEEVARLRGSGGEPPVRVGFGDGFSAGEIRSIQANQEMRAAAYGGGGWKPPTPPRNAFGDAFEPNKPNGFYFEYEGSSGAKAGGYAGRGAEGERVTLEAETVSKTPMLRETVARRVDWKNATVRQIDPVPVSGELASLKQIAFEVELPLRDLPFLEKIRVQRRQNLFWRIVTFFKGEPTAVQQRAVLDAIERARTVAVDADPLIGDSMIALKAELLRNLQPAALRYQIKYGTNDVTIVDADAAGRTRAEG